MIPFNPDLLSPKQQMLLGDSGILFCSLLWGLSFSTVKLTLNYYGPLWIIALRFLISLAILLTFSVSQLKTLTIKDWIYGFTIGSCFVGACVSQALGLRTDSTGTIAFLTAGYVALLPFLLWLCGRRPLMVDFFCATVCLVGMALLSLGPGLTGLHVSPWGISSAVFAAGQVLFIELFSKKSQPLPLCLTQMISGAIVSIGLAFYLEGPIHHFPLISVPPLFYLSVGCTLIPFFVQLVAQPLTTPTRASLIYSLESVFAGIFGFFWLGENMSLQNLVGCGFIFGAVVLNQLLTPSSRSIIEKPSSQS